MAGKIFLIPVPLAGGPLDNSIPQLNMRITGALRHFVVENIRSARRFLKKMDPGFDIDGSTFTVLNEQTSPKDVPAMLDSVLAGENLGIISEAGCPAVADPGALLVEAAQRRGIEVVPLVGPSSILLSLMGSGFNGQSFAFVGYLPIEKAERSAYLKKLENRSRNENQTQIFIETPYRNNQLLATLCQTLSPDTRLCVAANLTSSEQKIITRSIREWSVAKADFNKIPTIFLIHRN